MPPRILVAPDKFKGCLDATAVADAMARGLRRADPSAEIDLCPMADGGEGIVEALVNATGGSFQTRRVMGPLPDMKVDARFGILGDGRTAVIEMSAASGLALLKSDERNPLATTTFGTGELLMAAAALGATHIILGIGGSATNDAGIGCAQACGLPVIFDDASPVANSEPLTGADVSRVMYVKHGRGSPIERVKITVACDVDNPLLGPRGASRIYGPQKGATPEQIAGLDLALEQLARRNDKLDVAAMPGAGAAGGLGFGMAAFFGATLRSGIEIVIQAVNLNQRMARADLCLTGEGRLDMQSLSGKTVLGVARTALTAGKPCIVLAGAIESHGLQLYSRGITAAFSICDRPMPLEESIASAATLLSRSAENVLRAIKHQKSSGNDPPSLPIQASSE